MIEPLINIVNHLFAVFCISQIDINTHELSEMISKYIQWEEILEHLLHSSLPYPVGDGLGIPTVKSSNV